MSDTNDVARPSEQALAVPVEPASGLAASRCDPSREHYVFTNGFTLSRDPGGWMWRLRDQDGELVDSDQYRHDVIERYRLTVALHHEPENPWLRDSDTRRKAETGTGSVRSTGSAGPKDIAHD